MMFFKLNIVSDKSQHNDIQHNGNQYDDNWHDGIQHNNSRHNVMFSLTSLGVMTFSIMPLTKMLFHFIYELYKIEKSLKNYAT
jgi:hypothetical protein